jgi:hypothetical protein
VTSIILNLLQVYLTTMNIPKGGRGKRAPYETTTIRVPVPLLETIETQVNQYREFAVNGTPPAMSSIVVHDDAIACAKEILKQKKSARHSLEKLLQVLLSSDISLKD